MSSLAFDSGPSHKPQVFLSHECSHALGDRWVACYLEGTATIDCSSQILDKGNASRALFDVNSHLFAGARFNAAIQVLGKTCKQIAALIGPLG